MTTPDFEKIFETHRDLQPPPPEVWTAPLVLAPQWVLRERRVDGCRYTNKHERLSVIVSCELFDGRWWVHLSASHEARVPTWYELVKCKELFLGNREAYQVIPPRERYVNINPNVLHLFALADGSAVLPDFTKGSGSL